MPVSRAPADCTSMAELRTQIDVIDADLIDLLALRATYIDRAVPLKQAAGLPAHIGGRVDEVIANVRARAAAQHLDPDLAEALWTTLIDWSIARETRHLPD